MSDHLTEEEQIENLKRLWKEYGTSIIASVVVATAGYLGWNYWQETEQRKAETASEYFEQMLTANMADRSTAEGEAAAATLDHLAEQIRQTDSGSFYAVQSAFLTARQAVEAGELEKAASELEQILANTDDPSLRQIARLRLARVLAEQGQYDAALAQLGDQPVAGFESQQAEVQGDVLRAKGDKAAAVTAYEKALEKFSGEDQQRRILLEMKLDNIKPLSALEEPSA